MPWLNNGDENLNPPTHHPECLSQQTLLDVASICTCPKKWGVAQRKALRAEAKLARERAAFLKLIHHEACTLSIDHADFAQDACACPDGWPRPRMARKIKSVLKKGVSRSKRELMLNPCRGAERKPSEIATEHFALRMDFTPSNAQMVRYCESRGYRMEMNWQAEPPAPTFDETALMKLMERYPKDALFPLIQRYRQTEKCKGTYVDGIYIRPDERVGGEFGHLPKTGRLSQRNPNHQNVSRTSDPLNPYYKVREMYIAAPDHRLLEADFSGIEAVLTMYYAGVHANGTAKMGCEDAKQGLRLTGIDIHGYLSSHDIGQPADLSWSDADLRDYLAAFRKENRTWKTKSGLMRLYEDIRDCNKTGLYGSLYMGGPGTLVRAKPDVFPNEAIAAAVQGLIFELFPSVPRWWWEVCREAMEFGYVTTPDGYRQYFSDVLEKVFHKKTQTWDTRMARVANECVAAKPQHTAMLYTAQGLGLFAERYPQERDLLRLTIHDSVVAEPHKDIAYDLYQRLKACMETPLKFLRLPSEWAMGEHLRIGVDGKQSEVGGSWREMKKIKLAS